MSCDDKKKVVNLDLFRKYLFLQTSVHNYYIFETYFLQLKYNNNQVWNNDLFIKFQEVLNRTLGGNSMGDFFHVCYQKFILDLQKQKFILDLQKQKFILDLRENNFSSFFFDNKEKIKKHWLWFLFVHIYKTDFEKFCLYLIDSFSNYEKQYLLNFHSSTLMKNKKIVPFRFRPDFDPESWKSQKQDLYFQFLDIDSYTEKCKTRQGQIYQTTFFRIFGNTKQGHSVMVTVCNFKLYFYVQLNHKEIDPNKISMTLLAKKLHQYVEDNIHYTAKSDFEESDLVYERELYGFTNGEKFPFLRLSFRSIPSMKKAIQLFKKPVFVAGVGIDKQIQYQICEENIEDEMKFFHDCLLTPTGWISVPFDKLQFGSDSESLCQIHVKTDYRNLNFHQEDESYAPFVFLSFDIETNNGIGKNEVPAPEYPENCVIEIGSTVFVYHDKELKRYQSMFHLRSCPPIENVDVRCFETEKELLEQWMEWLKNEIDPDFIIGYNTDYDKGFIFHKLQHYGIPAVFGRIPCQSSNIRYRNQSDDTDGEGVLSEEVEEEKGIHVGDRVFVARSSWDERDLYQNKIFRVKSIDKKSKMVEMLDPLKSNNNFEKVLTIEKHKLEKFGFHTTSTLDISGRIDMDIMRLIKKDPYVRLKSYGLNFVSELFLGEKKHDVHPAEITCSIYKTILERETVARYCIQDTILPIKLMKNQKHLEKMIGMARVTYVTLNTLATKGQQIKVLSQIIRECHQHKYKVLLSKAPPNSPYFPHTWDHDYLLSRVKKRKANLMSGANTAFDMMKKQKLSESNLKKKKPDKKKNTLQNQALPYEGAVVIEPKRGAYLDDRVATLDFSSLYPSIMIAQNLCYTTMIKDEKDDAKYGNIPGLIYKVTAIKNTDEEIIESYKVVIGVEKGYENPFVQGIIPHLLQKLLNARRATKADMKKLEYDSFEYVILDATQLGLKISCNSVYGFTGVRSKKKAKLPCLPIAVTTTFYGRTFLQLTQKIVEENFDATVIYGDTDSVFIVFYNLDPEGKMKNIEIYTKLIELGSKAAKMVTELLPPPLNLIFEKWFDPFLLYTKKGYAGIKFEGTNPNIKGKLSASGLAAVRRDGCDYTRSILNDTMNIILNEKNIPKAIEVVKERLMDLVMGKVDIENLKLSNSLSKDFYVNPQAHAEVAKKMANRGKFIQGGDRIFYVFIKIPGESKDTKTWEKAEDPEYVVEHNLPLDYLYYIEHQMRNPIEKQFSILMKDPKTLFHDAINYLQNKNTKSLFQMGFTK